MRSTYRVALKYRVLGVVFLIANFFVLLGSVDMTADESFVGALLVVLVFFVLGVIFLIKSHTETRKRTIAYEKGDYYNGEIKVKKWTEVGDYKNLRIGVVLDGEFEPRYLTDANCYRPEEFEVGDRVRICLYKNMVLLDDFNDDLI